MPRLIDLTLLIHEGMFTPPVYWHPMVEITIIGRLELEGRLSRRLTLGTHVGTHVDAPAHMILNGKTIDEIPLETLIGEATIVDMSHKGELDAITANDLSKFKTQIKKGDRVLLRTNWSARWGTKDFYKRYPYLTKDAATWLVRKGIKALGMDTPSPDDPREGLIPGKISPIHKVFFENGITLIEYLTNLDEIKSQRVKLIALPLRIKDGDGAPARVIAIESQEESKKMITREPYRKHVKEEEG